MSDASASMDGMIKPLKRFKVLDLTIARAGPATVRLLADWGAEVIRIEQPAQDAASDPTGATRHSPDFQNLHRNKRSITLDLKSERGRALFYKMCESADIVVENMRPNVKTRLGVDYETLRKINPRIVYGSISGFGQDGPYVDRPGVDQIAQGMGGLMSITGLPGQGPVRVGIPMVDLCGGAFLAQGILVALLEREQTGQGRWVTTSLLESVVSMLDFQAARWLIKGEVAEQAGNDHPTAIPTGVFPTADGHINIAASGQRMWTRLGKALGLDHLLEDSRFIDGKSRLKNKAELNALISEVSRTKPSAYWIEHLTEASVPCGPINTIDQVFDDPQVQHLNLTPSVSHDQLGELHLVGSPFSLDGQRYGVHQAAPERGEHTDEILGELGLDPEEISELHQQNVV